MMSKSPNSLPTAITQQLFELALQFKAQLPKITEEFDLPAMQGQLIHHLEPGAFVQMNALAKGMNCDPSNITGIVDRLEHRGLIERHVDPKDRRIKLLGLSAEGVRLRKKLLARLFAPFPGLRQLSSAEQQTLYDLLKKLDPISKPIVEL
jgi:DNA-binding MarR family transcriptional regulator